MDACTTHCGFCGMCTAAWEDDDNFGNQEQEMPDPIGMAERNALEAVTDFRGALGRCETVAQVIALKARISALWLAWDCLDQDALRKADGILNEAAELHSQKVA